MTIRKPRRPKSVDPVDFQQFEGSSDPALVMQLAHESAAALVRRVRETNDPEVRERLLAYTSEHGVDELAELWSVAPAHSLPGALWRLYLVHASIVRDPVLAAEAFRVGSASLHTIDEVLVGAPKNSSPEDIREVADHILAGAFVGDLSDALDRAAAYCRISAHGLTVLLGESEIGSSATLERAVVLDEWARDFRASAALVRAGKLN